MHSNPTLQVQDGVHLELAMFTAKLDAAAFSFLNYTFTEANQVDCDLEGLLPPQFDELDEWIKFARSGWNVSIHYSMVGWRDSIRCLQHDAPLSAWVLFEALSRAILFKYSDEPSDSRTMIVLKNVVKEIEDSAQKIPETLNEAVAHKPLDVLVQGSLRRRWNRLDMLLDAYHDETATSRQKGVPTWSDLANIIKNQTITSERLSGHDLKRMTTSLWLCAFALLVTVPSTAQGLRYSLHQPGTPRDADFWFQIQSSCMTILNLATLAIPIWKSKALSRTLSLWLWGLLTSASLGVGIAPFVYVFAPTEWSFLMNVFAGILQAFITLQIALVADTKGVESLKKD